MIQPDALKTNQPLVWSPGTGATAWAMFCAAAEGDVSAIRRLLDDDPSLVRCAYEYRTPLSFAVRENRLAAAALLLERGANPIASGTADTLLVVARDRGYVEMQALLEGALAGAPGRSPAGAPVAAAIRARDLAAVHRLLDAAPALVHAPDERSNQPIHWAVMTRQIDVIDALLARGADVNARRADGARPIQLTNGDYTYRGWRDVPAETTATPGEVLTHLRTRGAAVDICTAAHIGDFDRVRELLDQDPSRANRPSDYVTYYACAGTPLRNAAAAGHLEIVTLLLDRGADPNLPEEGIAPRGHALHAAVCNGHIDIVRLLLAKGAYPNVDIESSADTLSAAIRNDDQPMIDLLCAHGAARSVAILAYHGEVREAAAVFAADPRLADDPAALANAAGQGHDPFVRLMLRYQPELPKRMTFQAWSIGAATTALNELLFQHGMDPNRRNWLRIAPLHYLAQKGDVEAAGVFIAHGADVNARDEELRSTPLGYAAKFGRIEMVDLLLQRGAEPSLPGDPPWATPLAWATRRGHAAIAARLAPPEARRAQTPFGRPEM
jgi:ankyrin repeat protein